MTAARIILTDFARNKFWPFIVFAYST